MFNLYHSVKQKDEPDNKELDVIGHDRFCQIRPSRSVFRKKKYFSKRSKSVCEFTDDTLRLARQRNAFNELRRDSNVQTNDCFQLPSLSNIGLRKRSSSVPRHEYSALRLETNNERLPLDKQIIDGKFSVCRHYLRNNDRYEFKTQLGDIGSRTNKHWFVVQDTSLDAERLLSLIPLPSTCPISPSNSIRETLLSLFRALQHPYIHPILDVEFWEAGAALISPLNPSGSLKDLIYGENWFDDYERKYRTRGVGLDIRQIQCLGRQILEALLFLKTKNFPPFYHLNSGNVIIQNGVARLAGLENVLFGLNSRPPYAVETIAFGYLLYEITLGYELTSSNQEQLQIELERYPKISEVLNVIFNNATVAPNVEDILCCDLFRGVELRELRGTPYSHNNVLPSDVQQMLEMCKNPIPPPSPSVKRRETVVAIESRQLEDIIEENEDKCS